MSEVAELRDYFKMVDRMQGPIDPTAQSQDTPTLRLVTENIRDTNESTMEVIMISPDRNEPHNRSRTWMLVAACVGAVAVVGGLIVAVVEQPTEAEKTTTAAEPTLPPSGGTVEVPFYVIDADTPVNMTCGAGIPGFNISFSDGSGGSTVVEARIEDDSVPDEVVNTTCTVNLFEGVPSLFYAAVLDAPAAETYESIEL
jgi:hypothetical protein